MKEKMKLLFPERNIQHKWAFVTTVIIMLVTHLYMFTNKIVNHDDVNRLLVGDTNEAKIQHGRWAGVIFDPVSGSSVGIPYVMGILSILAFAGTAVVLVSVFQIRKKITVILFCGLLCTFPVSANIFLYSYIADIYFISMFLAVWGVWLILQDVRKNNREGHFKGILGVIWLTLACGCYQAFWCVGMAILFLFFLLEFLDVEEWRTFAVKLSKCLLMSAVSLVLYLVINKIVQEVTGYGATAYEGLDSMGQFGGVSGFLKVIAVAYYEFLQFFYLKGSFVVSRAMIIFNLFLTISVAIMLIQRAKKKKHPRGYWIIFVFFIGCIPLASNLVSVVSSNATHILMQYAFLLPYFLCLILLERLNGQMTDKKGRINVISVSAYVFLTLIAYKGYLTDNEVYFRQQLNYEATYSYTLRLLSRIETMEGYKADTQIAMINENPQEYDHITIMMENYPEEMAQFDYLNGMQGTEPHTFVKRANDISDFCKYYHGYDLQMVGDDAVLQELGRTKAFGEMTTYPEAGSMRYIDDVLVIKLADQKQR